MINRHNHSVGHCDLQANKCSCLIVKQSTITDKY